MFEVSVIAVINAVGVWTGENPSLKLRPSFGTSLIFDARLFANPTAALTIPIPGGLNRFVFTCPNS
ncbi:hypothetical protein DIJ64_09780 [Mycobacterium leprae]|uniref:Uncharacterized protein n=1 Tax=Mycobacterium leprae TaxID=1769 RepID=A0AAD0KRE2_MYCLR|nr:hypothetical protein DIJ64_09780 [Mycobacterium leprae]OAR19916.1 hypothetical protein A8144_13020 [Mycobacterium leprae 3125609]OAX72187.1 hypothetical protein A3216_00015 [Mycobacterium leprae 7935681]